MASVPVPQDLIDYAQALFAPTTPALESLTSAAKAAGMPDGWEITPDVGRLFQLLCRAVRAKRVLEFGTFAGHSAWWFANSVVPDGDVVTIEANPAYAAHAQRQFESLGISDRVEIFIDQGLDSMGRIEGNTSARGLFDVIFLDADKAHYPEFLKWCPRVLKPGGILLADNVLRSESWNGQGLLEATSDDARILGIREFNRELAADKRFTATIIPLRAGIAAALYQP